MVVLVVVTSTVVLELEEIIVMEKRMGQWGRGRVDLLG